MSEVRNPLARRDAIGGEYPVLVSAVRHSGDPAPVIRELTEALNDLAAVTEKAAKPSNKAGGYYYVDVVLKRWHLGAGGRSGNCERCIENADAGEIEEDDFFPADGQWGYVDEPPLHSHCTCWVTYRDTRKRVYV